MTTKLQRGLCLVCILGWIGGSVACGDDDPSDTDPLEEEDASVSNGSGTGGRGGSGGRAGRGGSGGRAGRGGSGGMVAEGGAGGSMSARGGSGGATAAGGAGGSGVAAGSGGAGGAGGAAVAGGAGGAMSADAGVRLNDAQIVAVTSAVNQSEIEAGNLAIMRARQEPAREFAQMMVTMHTAVQERQIELAMRLNLTPADNPVSMMVQEEAQMTRTMLMQASDEQFDEIYAGSQVTAHSMALMIIDEVLLPSVMDATLRAELILTRVAVVDHLAMAQEVFEAIRSAGDAGM